MQLLERSETIQRLGGAAARAADGHGNVVCLVGEAGIGKSSVARELAEGEHKRGRLRVFWGACEDLSTPAPLAPLYDFARIGNWKLPPSDDLSSRLHSFSIAFGELSAAPTLVVLEDLHWADDATADFVRYIARRVVDAPVLLLATARNETVEAQSRLRRALADVATESVERIELPRLSEGGVRSLAKAHGMDGDAVFALTSGNPFLTTEVLRGADIVPPTVRDALLWRADKLDHSARQCLNAASIFPRRVEQAVLRNMCGSEGEAAITACMAAGLLVAEDGFYAFRHQIARRAIEEAIPLPERTNLNRDALRILLRMNSIPTARLVHHAIEAEDVDVICDLAPRAAAEASEAGAHREAAKHYAAALVHAQRIDDDRLAELHEKSGYELQLIGRLGDAIKSFEAALTLRRKLGQDLKTGDDLRWLGRLNYNNGDRAAATRLGKQAVEVLKPAGPTFELAMAYANYALLAALRDDAESAVDLANVTLALAKQLGRDDIAADAHGTLGISRQWIDPDAAFQHFKQALEIALALKRPELVARIYNNGGGVQLNVRMSEGAREWLQKGIEYCNEHDLLPWSNYMRGLLAELFVREGEWSAARELAEWTLKGDLSPVARFPASVALALLRMRGGEDATSLLAALTFDDEPQRMLVYAPVLGEHAWIRQIDVEATLQVLQQAAPIAAKIGNVWAAGEIAFWRFKLARELPPEPDSLAPPYRSFFAGDWNAAAKAWQAMRTPYDAALALLEGDSRACDEALSILDSLGATGAAARARRELREKGMRNLRRGPRASTQRNKAGLTGREMEVLLLLGEGLSNAEIARQLRAAVKTVDHHVSAILGKLKSSSRGEAVARARQMGLVQ